MNRLYLLGVTKDLEGVVFAQRKGAKKPTFWVPVDETFREAIVKLERARREQDGEDLPDLEARRVVLPPVGRSQATSRIPASEIQQLLREGRTVATVAQAARVSRAWVERLAEPVEVEREGVVRMAQRAFMPRPRLGPSGLPVGQAVARNLEERRATLETLESVDEGWDARATRSGPWRVRLRFKHRGSRKVAEWDFVKATRKVDARNRLAVELGWWPPDAPPEPPPEPDEEEGDAEVERPREKAAPKRKPVRRTSSSARSRGSGSKGGARRGGRAKATAKGKAKAKPGKGRAKAKPRKGRAKAKPRKGAAGRGRSGKPRGRSRR